jgi:hypothetical protein
VPVDEVLDCLHNLQVKLNLGAITQSDSHDARTALQIVPIAATRVTSDGLTPFLFTSDVGQVGMVDTTCKDCPRMRQGLAEHELGGTSVQIGRAIRTPPSAIINNYYGDISGAGYIRYNHTLIADLCTGGSGGFGGRGGETGGSGGTGEGPRFIYNTYIGYQRR